MQESAKENNSPGGVLIVDDELSVLSSLKRCLRTLECNIHTAASGMEGLKILEQEPIDLVISDMRMPEMDGAAFLEQVTKKWPETIRFLLTGYSDINSTISAINKGKIHNYLSKPWDDEHIKLSVCDALERSNLHREKQRLEKLTQEQNAQLKELNTNLEKKVAERTEELKKTMQLLEKSYTDLRKSYTAAIPVFANLVELREREFAGHCRRVAEYAKNLAQAMELSAEEVEAIYFAALLHNIGKIGLPDELCHKAYFSLSKTELECVQKHPLVAESALLALDSLSDTAKIIRHQHETLDGKGYPDKLKDEKIPLGAKILSLVIDYDELQLGLLMPEKLTKTEALNYLQEHKNKRYADKLVDKFAALLAEEISVTKESNELKLSSSQVKSGMKLTQDLISQDGMLLLTSGHVLNDRLIQKVLRLEKESGKKFTLYVAE